MIESNIINYFNSDGKRSKTFPVEQDFIFYKMIRHIMILSKIPPILCIAFKISFFIQILIEVVLFSGEVQNTGDNLVKFADFISVIFLFDKVITENDSYRIAFFSLLSLWFIYIITIISLYLYVKSFKIYLNLPIYFVGISNSFFTHILITPIINILLLILKCKNSQHLFISVSCFSTDATSNLFYFYFTLSLIILLFYLLYVYVFAYYGIEIGNTNDASHIAHIRSNYKVYSIFLKIFIFISLFLIRNYLYTNYKTLSYLLFQSVIFIISLMMNIYNFKRVLFYTRHINFIINFGWIILQYSSFISIIKIILNINDTSLFHIVGWLGLLIIYIMLGIEYDEKLIFTLDIFNLNSVKEVVCFTEKILSFCTFNKNYNPNTKTVGFGITNMFEELVENNPDISIFHYKFAYDNYMMKKFPNKTNLKLLSLAYVVYNYYLKLEKNENINRKQYCKISQEEIMLHCCYFLMSNIKNFIYSAYLCAKINVTNSKNKFLTYLLMEEIKHKCISKLYKVNSNESIKRIQIGVVLSFQNIFEKFVSNINDEINLQNEYFSILQKKTSFAKDTEDLLSISSRIYDLKKDIVKNYKSLIELNPSEEAKIYYNFYLNTVVQESDVIKSENKLFDATLESFLKNRGPIYKSMFEKQSSVIIVDGHVNVGSIIYTTPIFFELYNITEKIGLTVHDLVPSALEKFHYDVVLNGIKFSNLSNTFNKQRILPMRGKSGLLYLGLIYIRSIPEFKYGLNYIVSVIKQESDNNTCRIILDDNFIVNGVSNFAVLNFDVKQFLFQHMVMYIPNAIAQVRYSQQLGFYFNASNEEFMGLIYSYPNEKVFKNENIEIVVDKILSKIKNYSYISIDDPEIGYLMSEVENLSNSSFIVHYKVSSKFFCNNLYKYHTISINQTSDQQNLFEQDDSRNLKNKNNSSRFNSKHSEKNISNINLLKLKSISYTIENQQIVVDNYASSVASSKHSLSSSNQEALNFNICKHELSINKGNIFPIRSIKYSCIIFFVFSIALSIQTNSEADNNFKNMNKFLIDNKLLEDSNLILIRAYSAVQNIKNLREGIYPDQIKNLVCIENTIDNKCKSKDFYLNVLKTSIDDAMKGFYKISSFEQDLTQLLLIPQITNAYNTFSINSTNFMINTHDTVSVIISKLLKLSANINDYLLFDTNNLNNDELINIITDDVLNMMQMEFVDESLTLFEDVYIFQKFSYGDYFLFNTIVLGINILLIFIVIAVIIYFNVMLYKLEKNIINGLIIFNTPLLQKHLENINALVKKMKSRNDGELQEELNNIKNLQINDKDDKEEDNDNEDKDDWNRDKKWLNKKKTVKKSKKKESNISKYNKSSIMSIHFKNVNFFTTIKIGVILILSIIYNLVLIFMIKTNVNNLYYFHLSAHEIENYFQSDFKTYFAYKYELDNYYKTSTINNTRLFNNNSTNLINLLFDLESYFNNDDSDIINLKNLLQGDTCKVLYSEKTAYDQCDNFISNELKIKQGINQAVIFFKQVFIPNFLNNLNNLQITNDRIMSFRKFYIENSFHNYDIFMEVYFYKAFLFTYDIMNSLKTKFINTQSLNMFYLFISFICFWIVFLILNPLIIKTGRETFNSLSKFIFIVPPLILMEDKEMTNILANIRKHI